MKYVLWRWHNLFSLVMYICRIYHSPESRVFVKKKNDCCILLTLRFYCCYFCSYSLFLRYVCLLNHWANGSERSNQKTFSWGTNQSISYRQIKTKSEKVFKIYLIYSIGSISHLLTYLNSFFKYFYLVGACFSHSFNS